jgi:hypothetical protein
LKAMGLGKDNFTLLIAGAKKSWGKKINEM